MNYEVKPLTPELAETFCDYLSNLSFEHAPHWAGCFCRYYHSNCSFEEWRKRTNEENHMEAMEQIKNSSMKGYLAFDGDKCIGWCNANDINEFKRLEGETSHIVKDKRVGCVICFVIHPEYRKQGVARLLLRHAIEGFKDQGYEGVLSIPVDVKDVPEKSYRGTMNMYKECGFEEIETKESSHFMWLKL
jgi:GNAT superfamily N-acetyltransferase